MRSRSMVAVTLRCRVNGSQVTQGWSINRRGCGCATWVCCGSEGEGETAGLRVGCSGGRVVKGRSDEGRRSTTVEGVGSGGTWRRRDWHTGWLGKRSGEVCGKAQRGHGVLIKAPLADGDLARRSAVTRRQASCIGEAPHYANETTSKRERDTRGLGVPGQASSGIWGVQICPCRQSN